LLDLDDEEDTSPPSPSVEVEDEGYDLPAEQEEESTPSVPPVAANGEDVPMQAADEKQKAQDVALPLEYQQNCIYILDYYAVFASKDFINYEKKYIKNDGFFQPLLQMFRKEVKPITSHLQLSDLFKLTSFLVENPELLYSRVANSSAAFLFDKNVFNTINKCAIQLSYLEIIVARYNAFHGQTTQFLAKSLSSTLTAEHKGEQKGNPNDDQTSLKRKREETAAPEGTAPEDAPSANKKGRTEPHTVPTASAVDTDGDAKMTSAKPKP